MKVLLIDPSRFTEPYNAQLTTGLTAAGVDPLWATRKTRETERAELPEKTTWELFYRKADTAFSKFSQLRSIAKVVSHVAGMRELVRTVGTREFDIVHFQWTVFPLADSIFMLLMKKRVPVVLTAHDSIPYNGSTPSFLQVLGYFLPHKIADAVIVHTEVARNRLIERGVNERKIFTIPHGPLFLKDAPPTHSPSPRYTFTFFGHIKTYKGVDVLVRAIVRIRDLLGKDVRFVIAGKPYIEIDDLRKELKSADVENVVEFRLGFLPEAELSTVLNETDCFLFPYHQIDASGAYFLAKGYRRWIIASAVGIFAEDIVDGATGTLVPPGDVDALAKAIAATLQDRPRARAAADVSWDQIGARTLELYERLRATP